MMMKMAMGRMMQPKWTPLVRVGSRANGRTRSQHRKRVMRERNAVVHGLDWTARVDHDHLKWNFKSRMIRFS